jgi:hypothetical protein
LPTKRCDIQATAEIYTGALDNTQVTVNTQWKPDNNPGSTVQVTVTYNFATVLVPLSATTLPVQTTACAIITQ